MIDNFGELICVQLVYAVILFVIAFNAYKRRENQKVYLVSSGLYITVIVWLIFEYIRLGPHPDPGSAFAWGILSMVIPGVLVIITLLIFVISQLFKIRSKSASK